MSRADYVRMQSDAMGHAIAASERGDTKSFRGAVEAVMRAGKALGSRADTSENHRMFEAQRPPLATGTRKKRPRGRVIVPLS